MSKNVNEQLNMYYILTSNREKLKMASKVSTNNKATAAGTIVTKTPTVAGRDRASTTAPIGYVEIPIDGHPETPALTTEYMDRGLQQPQYVDLTVVKPDNRSTVFYKTNTVAGRGSRLPANEERPLIILPTLSKETAPAIARHVVPEDHYLLIMDPDRFETKKTSPSPATTAKQQKPLPPSPGAIVNVNPKEDPYLILSTREDLKDNTRRRKLVEGIESLQTTIKSPYEKLQPKNIDVTNIPAAIEKKSTKGKRRKISGYLRLILSNERNKPKLCPRILTIVLIWIVLIVGIFGYGWVHTTWFNYFKCDNDKEFIYVQSKLMPAGNITEY